MARATIPTALNERVRYFREAVGLTQDDLAVRVGVTRQSISEIETAGVGVSVERARAIARALGITTWLLLGEEPPIPLANAG